MNGSKFKMKKIDLRKLRRWLKVLNRRLADALKISEEIGVDFRNGKMPDKKKTARLRRLIKVSRRLKFIVLRILGLEGLYNDFFALDRFVDQAVDNADLLKWDFLDKEQQKEIRKKIKELLKAFEQKKREMEKKYPQPKSLNWFDGMNKWIAPMFKHKYIDTWDSKDLAELIEKLHKYKRYTLHGIPVQIAGHGLDVYFEIFEKMDLWIAWSLECLDNAERIRDDKDIKEKDKKEWILDFLSMLHKSLSDIKMYKVFLEIDFINFYSDH